MGDTLTNPPEMKVAEAVPGVTSAALPQPTNPNGITVLATPTQVRRPWRATARTLFAAVVGFSAMFPLIVNASGADQTWPPLAYALAIASAITRIMAVPAVEAFLQRFVPFLAAAPGPAKEVTRR